MAVKNFRIGNDLVVLWAICNRDGSPYNLANKQVRLFVMNERGRKEVVPVLTTLPDGSINNVIRWDFYGMEQRVMGLYTLSVEIFTDEDKKSIKKDYCEAFCLVGSSSLEDEDLADNISDGGELILSSSLDVIQLTIPRIEIGVNGDWIIDGIDSGVSALGGGPGLVNKIYDVLGFGKEYDPTSVIDTFNAYAINSLYGSIKDAEKDIQDAQSSINTLEEDVEYLKTFGGGGSGGSSGGGSISQEQLTAIMEAIGKKADKATTLEGYGITNAYNKTYIDSTLNKYILLSASHQTIKGDITIEGNLVVKGDMASQGEGNPSLVGASGVIVGATEYRDLNGDGLIDLTSLMALYTPLSSHNSLASRVSTLEGKSTSVSVSQTLTSGKEIGAITIDGVAKSLYAPSTYDWSEIANQPSITIQYGYSGYNFEELKWSGRDLLFAPYRYLIADNMTGSPCMTWSINKLESEFAKYLPLSGGIITSHIEIASGADSKIVLNETGADTKFQCIEFRNKGTMYGKFGTFGTDTLSWYIAGGSINPLLHSGNVGEYAIVRNNGINTSTDNNVAGYGQVADGWPIAGPCMIIGKDNYRMLLSGRLGIFRFNTMENGTLSDWKTIAFTDSNVASATKLQTARTIWGQSFDGTANVSGMLFDINNREFIYSSGTWTRVGNGTAKAGLPTYIDGSTIYFRYGNSQSTGLILNTSGNVTIGGSDLAGSEAKLYVNGVVYTPNYMMFLDASKNKIGYIGRGSSTQRIQVGGYKGTTINIFANENPEGGIFLSTSCNVGIGTTSPSAKLHINGDSRVEGNFDIKTPQGGSICIFSITGNSTALKAFAYGDTSYIESGNSAYGSNMNLHIRGISGKTGANLTFSYSTSRFNGNVIVTGDLASGSDIRFKNIISNTSLDIKDIADAPLFTFKWNDREDNNTHLGTSAQYWESISPELVTGEEFKTLNYASLGVAIGISLAKKALSHEERIKVLEEKVNELETENRRLRYGN